MSPKNPEWPAIGDCLPLQGVRVQLRRLAASDLADFQAYRSDAEVSRYQGWTAQPDAQALAFLTEMGAAEHWPLGDWLQLGIALDGRLIGDIGLCRRQAGERLEAEIGFSLAASAQGQGLAREALELLIALLFERLDVARVVAITDARNSPSIALLQRLGAQLEKSEDVIFQNEPCVEHGFVIER